MQFWNKLKTRWGIQNNWQVLLILIAFSLAGPTTLVVHKQVDTLLGIDDGSSFWLKFLVFMVIVLPVYNFFLLIYGIILGQYSFFTNFLFKKLKFIQKLNSLFNLLKVK